MSRRRRTRKRRSKGTSYWLIGLQVLVLTGVLVFLIVFRDYLSMTASSVMTGWGKGDLQVQQKPKEEPGSSPPGSTGGDVGTGSGGSVDGGR